MTDFDTKRYVPAATILKRYDISDMTLHRWIHDVRRGFPKPVYFGRIRYFDTDEIVSYERDCIIASQGLASARASTDNAEAA